MATPAIETPPEAQADTATATVTATTSDPKPAGTELSPEALQAELRRARDDAAKYRTQVRELQPLADKAREAEEAKKDELQKANDRLAELQQAADKATADALRYRLAATHQIKPDDVDLLGSGTEEEMTARAQRIAALYGQQTPQRPPAVPGRPIEDLKPGATPTDHESPEEKTWRDLGFPPVKP